MNETEDISGLPWIKWGTDNEKKGIEKSNSLFPEKITKCGCFINKNEVNILASPDGLVISKKNGHGS